MEYSKDVVIHFGFRYKDINQEAIELKIGDNEITSTTMLHSITEMVRLESITTIIGTCFKISYGTIKGVDVVNYLYFHIELNDNIPIDELPIVDIYFTSEKNAYGISMAKFEDGDEVLVEVYEEAYVHLNHEKTVFLESKGKCSNDHSFYECLASKIISLNYTSCPTRCSPISYANLTTSIPLCETEEEIKCAKDLAYYELLGKKCLKYCERVSYSEKISWKDAIPYEDQGHNFWVYYRTTTDEMFVNEEYQIYNFNSMIGSIGGTLGLFIGFAFTNVISLIISHCKDFSIKKSALTSNGVGNMPLQNA